MKKYFGVKFLVLFLLAVVVIVPATTKALTMQELLGAQQAPHNVGMVLGASTPSPDINGDGIVNSLDIAILLAHMGQNYPPADLNHDGIVNSLDYSILVSQWFFTR